MAEDLSAQLNSTPGCIPAKWSRSTIADGDWLQAKTLAPLSSRDNWLANQITQSEIDLETERRERMAADAYLSAVIDPLSSDLYSFSGKVETSAVQITNQIQTETDRATYRENELEQLITNEKNRAEGKETELQQHINEEKTRAEGAEDALDTRLDTVENDISTLKAATDVIMVYGTYDNFSATSGELILTDADVIKVLVDETTNNEQVYYQWYDPASGHEWSNWSAIGSLEPYYSKSEIDGQLNNIRTEVQQQYLSNVVHDGRNITTTLSQSYPEELTIATKDDVSFSNLTSTNISATTTKSTNFSGSTLSGETLYTSIDGLIASATNGGAMTGVKNVSGIKLTHIANQSDYVNNPDDGEFSFSTSADQLTFYVSGGAAEWLKPTTGQNPYGICLTGEKIENYLGGKSLNVTADYAYTAGTTLDEFTATTPNHEYVGKIQELHLSAGKGIDFVSGNDGKLTISSEGTTYTTGQYINISNDNKISVTGTLINSARSGQSAYNWITGQSATLSAGPGIQFTSAARNTMGITITAGGVGGVITAIAGSALSAGSNYIGSDYIYINPNNNSINLSSHISADIISANEIQIKTEYYSAGLDYGGLNMTGNNRSYTASINLSYTNARYNSDSFAGEASWSAIINNANSNWVSSNPAGISISSTNAVKLVFTPTLPPTLDDNTYYIV